MGLYLPPAAYYLAWTVRAIAVAVSISIAANFFDRSSLFSWHPTLMALGFLLFLLEGILGAVMFRPLVGETRVAAIWQHAFSMGPALLCIALGFYAIYQNKIDGGKEHFKSLHGKVGLATLLLTVFAPIGGVVSFRKLGLLTLFPASMHPMIKLGHKSAGVVVLLMALVTIELVLLNPYMNKGVFTPLWQGGVALLGGLLLMLMTVAKPQSDKSKEA